MASPDPRLTLAPQPWLPELLAASGEGIALFDTAGRIVAHNPLLPRLVDLTAETLDGRLIDDLLTDERYPLALAAARSRGHWSGRLVTRAGLISLRLRLGPTGHGVLLAHDVSETVELGRRAELLAARLEHHVTEADQARELLFEQSERLTAVYRITLDALESATIKATAERLCQVLADDLGAENVALWLLDQDQALLRRIGAVGRLAKRLPISCLRNEAPHADRALGAGHAVPAGGAGPLAAFAVFPLPGRDHHLGLLTLDGVTDLDRVQVYTPHLASAINNAIMAEELARANVQLRAIDQQKSEFLNIVAHDLRTPLSCIRTYTDLIQMYVGEEPETYAEFLGIIAEETERMGELLDNFLDLARIENATLRYELEPVRLDEIGEHFVQVYRAQAAAEEIELTGQWEEMPPVIADRRRIEQVVSNLLSNAVKFTPRGGRVGLTVRWLGDRAEVAVSDTGPGIPVTERQRIFERFRQLGGGHERGGSGLGLAIAQAIVQHHGGRIWVEDGPEGGSRFVVCLPQAPPADSLAAKAGS